MEQQKITVLNEDGEFMYEDLDIGEFREVLNKQNQQQYKAKFAKVMENYRLGKYEDMSLSDLEMLRKSMKLPNKIRLKFENGFYMVNKDMRNLFNELSLETEGFIHRVGFCVNKNGNLIYKNNRPIQSYADLAEHLNIKTREWYRIKKDIDKYQILRKSKIDGTWYIILNPMYESTSYEITYFKFLCFGKLLKERYLSALDYNYLCKLFEIVPE